MASPPLCNRQEMATPDNDKKYADYQLVKSQFNPIEPKPIESFHKILIPVPIGISLYIRT
jgi:hypothetical protein